MTDIFSKFSLEGKVAVITGGVGLLGRQFCKTLAEAKANVVCLDIIEDEVTKYSSELSSQGLKVTGKKIDITDSEDVKKAFKEIVDLHGHLDVLICSAGLDPKFDSNRKDQTNNEFETYPLDLWKKAVDVNLTGLFLTTQAACQYMSKQKSGSIVTIASTYGINGPDQRIFLRKGQPIQYKPVYYSVTKAGVFGLTRYLAAYYAGKNIRVNSLSPGGVFNKHDPEFVENYSAKTILGRMANIDEMNGAVLFLASDASSYMTGANLTVDGGWTAW